MVVDHHGNRGVHGTPLAAETTRKEPEGVGGGAGSGVLMLTYINELDHCENEPLDSLPLRDVAVRTH